MSTYSTVDDLLLGDIPLGSRVDANKFVQDAADEMDSALGFIYVTPIDTSATGVPRHVGLLLKRINNHLASGRLILAVSAGGEDTMVQAYGLSLIKAALDLLVRITSGTVLEGVPLHNPADANTGATVKNVDANSGVEMFYDYFMTPGVWQPDPVWVPGGDL